MAVLGFCSLLLNLVRDRGRQLAWAPINRYVMLYAAVYMAGTLFSVNLDSSLNPGLLSVAFILFAVVLYNAVENRTQLDTLLTFYGHRGGGGVLLGVCSISLAGATSRPPGWTATCSPPSSSGWPPP